MTSATWSPGDQLERVLTRLATELAAEDITLDPDQFHDLARTWAGLDLLDAAAVRRASVPICCGTEADLAAFARAFHRTFGGTVPSDPPQQSEQTTEPGGGSGQPEPASRQELAATAERAERLGQRELIEIDTETLDVWFTRTRATRARRIRRRWRRTRHGEIDLRRTLARWSTPGGDQLDLARRRRRRTIHPLVLVLDVSGSMRAWAPGYLLLAQALVANRRRTRVFTLATRLTEVTDAFTAPDPRHAQELVNALVPDWSSGTRLGTLLEQVADTITGRPILVVISDGWEQGEVDTLAAAAARLRRHSRALHWVVPAAGRADFTPSTRGLQAVLPELTALHPGTTPDDLDDLVTTLGAGHG